VNVLVSPARILPLPQPDAEKRKTSYLGMIIFVASWTMMFGVIFFVYGALRISADSWPPLGLPLLPLLLPTINTVIMGLSSASMERGLFEIRSGNARRLAPWLIATAALGAVFCVLQWLTGAELFREGLTFDRGAYAAVYYGFAIIHAAHVLVGLLALIYLAVRAAMGAYSTPRHMSVRLWAIYWHFVGVIWLAIYLLIIVL
jgi:cytochrome c oxidase subunit 3